MTETELIDRLKQEFVSSPAWSDIQSVITRENDPTLGANELIVIPDAPSAAQPIIMLRIVVEPLIATD